MVKTPKTRHSKLKREPVTIDLDPASISRVSEAPEGAAEEGMENPAEARTEGPAERAPEERPEEKAAADQPASQHEEGSEETGQPREYAEPASESELGDDRGASAGAAPDTEESPARGEPQAAAAAEPPRRRGAGAAFAAGLVGGVAALLLAGGLQWAGVLPVPGAADSGEDQAVAALRQDVDALQGQLAELRNTPAQPAGVSEEVTQRLNALEGDLAGLQDTVSNLQEAVSSGEAGRGAGLETLQTRLSELESRVSELAQAGSGAAAGGDISSRLAALAQDVKAASQAAASASSAAEANAGEIGTLQSRVAELGRQVEARSDNRRFAPVIAAMALDSAIERGAPFESQLESYAAVAQDTSLVDELRPFAAEGLPSRAEIAAQASDAADRMVRAVRGANENAGVVDRLMASARSLVVVRPVGEAEGDSVPAIAARIESAVRHGDYDAALEQYQSLPQKAKAATADFADKLRALRAADRIVEQALSEALKSA